MQRYALLLSAVGLLGFCARALAAPQPGSAGPSAGDVAACKTLAARYSRARSRVMARVVDRPTRARLDYAAYDRNILLHVPKPVPPTPPEPRPKLEALTFGGALAAGSLRDRLAETPLAAAEKREPLAMVPLLDYLAAWDYDAAEKLLIAGAKVSEEKWGNAGIVRPLQRLATGYLHAGAGGAVELWAKVEFEPGVTFMAGVTDEDGDGYPEAYGRVDPEAVTPRLAERIRRDYAGRTLTPAEVGTYFHELASAWYQALNTVNLKPNESRPWPNKATEPDVARELGGLLFRQPTVVIRGKPHGTPLYNVFIVARATGKARAGEPGFRVAKRGEQVKTPLFAAARRWAAGFRWAAPRIFGAAAAAAPARAAQGNAARWRRELREWGEGSWKRWEQRLAPFQEDVRRQLAARPAEIKGLVGRDGFLFFRGSLEYLLSGDLRRQENGRDPFPAIVDYHRQLRARGIDLLLVVIPEKPEVFPEKVSAAAPKGGRPHVTPYTRKLLLELAEAGVESVDLLPAFLDARDRSPEPFYMPLDTHWSNTAVRLAAKLIGERVREYPWFARARGKPIAYTTRPAVSVRTGDVRGMLPDAEKLRYRPMKLAAQQVVAPGGRLYEDDPKSAIVVLGDSFCGVYHFEDCQHAGLSAHLAREIGMPVDLIMAHGSGPRIRAQLSRRGAAAVARKKLVVWTVVSRDLYRYWAPWEKVKVP